MSQGSGSSSSRRSGPSNRGSGGPSRGSTSGRPKAGPSRGGKSSGGDSRGSRGSSSRPGGRGGTGGRGNSGGRGSSGRGSGRGSGGRSSSRQATPKPTPRAERSGWGSVAQHGAAGATVGQRVSEQESEERFSLEEQQKFLKRQAKRAEIEKRTDGLREQARQAIERGGLPADVPDTAGDTVTVERLPLPGRPPKPVHVEKEFARIAGKEKGERAWRLYKRAGKEFENEQFTDARKTIKPLAETYTMIADLHELHGLCLYRLGKWDEAIEELELFRAKSGTAEQHPVLMDCHRAMGHWADVDELWTELGELSPSADLVSEGRIVAAGALADRGFIDSGIRVLEKGWKIPREPMEHHLRRAYALADLLERDGKLPKSRKLFGWVASKAPDFGDAAERAES
ncbi:MAG: hypothetical protein R8J94_18505 [Acidimicrobiia bacterium]|nr:hypothetical protein [Acidimicrobiia bacterium]